MADLLAPEEFEMRAAELALGVLEGEERLEAARLALADRGFRAAVEAWRTRLAPLLEEVAPEAPGTGLWPRIEASLDARPALAPIGTLQRWRMGAVGVGAAAAALAFALLLPDSEPSRAPVTIAQVTAASGEPLLVAHYDAESGTLRLRASNLPVGARVPELWLIPKGGAPQSLGSFNRVGVSEIAPDAAKRQLLVRAGSALAVTMEPAEGVPHAAPSGAILGSAPLATL